MSAWYDNEWGYANRVLDTTVALANARRIAATRYATKVTRDTYTVSRVLATA